MTTGIARGKSLILSWYDEGKPDPDRRKAFARDIDRFFSVIQEREHWRECYTTSLDAPTGCAFRASGRGWVAYPTGKGLTVTSVLPGWAIGWQNILETEQSDYIVSWIGHYARQYVHRSNIAKMLMAAWEKEGVVLHPFGSNTQVRRYSDWGEVPSDRRILRDNKEEVLAHWGVASDAPTYRSAWRNRNTLEPAIHQAIFHFLRAQRLVQSGFDLEAITAYDCVLHSLQYLDWTWAPGNPRRSRADLCKALGFSSEAAELAEHIYFLRNQFVAHAGGWRWWDAVEYIQGDFMSDAALLMHRALRKSADLEPSYRRIDPHPQSWSSWLIDHFPIVWSAIWFR